jgi:hypothetical protein
MRKIICVLICAATVSLSVPAMAQSVGKKISNTADTVGMATKKTVKKGTAKIVDKTYDGKGGPNGETIYINNKSKYYYIDAKGKKVWITKDKLKDKAE